jgi:hypothetical protein
MTDTPVPKMIDMLSSMAASLQDLSAAKIGAAPAVLTSTALTLPGNLTTALHSNTQVFLTGTGALSINVSTYTAGTGCVVRNNTNATVTITGIGYSSANIGPPGFGYTGISAGGIATIIAGTLSNNTYLDIRGDLV